MQTIVELHLDMVCLKCVVLQSKSKLLRFLQCINYISSILKTKTIFTIV